MRDIVFHVADNHMEVGLRAFFSRDDWHYALGCSRFEIDPKSNSDIYRVPGHTDGGVWKHAHENLEIFKNKYQHAIVILDEDFEPRPGANVLRNEISQSMITSGWARNHFEVVVIQPELEAWLWAPNQNVATAFGHESFDLLRRRLIAQQLWNAGAPKPHDMKRARDYAAKTGGKKTGGPIFKGVFGGISKRALDLCSEVGFRGFLSAVRGWYPEKTAAVAE